MATTSGTRTISMLSLMNNIRIHRQRAPKSMKQSFILNESLCQKIIEQAGNIKDSYVCEVYPGPGGLTKAILGAGAAHLSVVEKDGVFIPVLKELIKISDRKIKLYHDDVFRFNMYDTFPNEIKKNWNEDLPNAHIIGNLPFALSTALITQWVKQIALKESAWSKGRVPLTLAFQNETAGKVVAKSMDRSRCKLSVMCQNWCHIDHKITIPRKSIVPCSKDDIAVMQFIPRIMPEIDIPFEIMEKVICNMFKKGEGTCIENLMTLFPDKRVERSRRLMEESEVHPDLKPFALEMEDVARICRVYKSHCDKIPGLFGYDYRIRENVTPLKNQISVRL